MVETLIEATDLAVGYGDNTVLTDVTFALPRGRLIALVGPNGAGKSTLINTLIGLIPPLKGQIALHLTPNPNGSSHNVFSNIGFCAQASVMDWYTTVFTNVVLGPKLAGIDSRHAEKYAHAAIARMGITELTDKPVDHLSGGQQQRVQVARELARKPQLYLLDEPTTGLDVESSEQLLAYLKERTRAGATVLVSSHDLTILEHYADELLVLNDGRLGYYGALADFLANSVTGDVIDVTFDGATRALPATLAGLGTFADGVLSVSTAELSMATLLKRLAASELNVQSVSVRRPTLRELYLSLRRGQRDGS